MGFSERTKLNKRFRLSALTENKISETFYVRKNWKTWPMRKEFPQKNNMYM